MCRKLLGLSGDVTTKEAMRKVVSRDVQLSKLQLDLSYMEDPKTQFSQEN